MDGVEIGKGESFLWDTEVTGFGCKVTSAGKKVYILQYRPRAQARKEFSAPKRVTLGNHGEVTPDQARALASKLLLEVKAGGDPAQAFRANQSTTIATLAERFLTEHLPSKKRPPRASTIAHYEILFRCYVVPALGTKRVEAVTASDVERLHASMRTKPYMANRTLSVVQQAFTQAERWGLRPQHSNPAEYVEKYPEHRRGAKKEVMLDAKQMGQLLAAIDAAEKKGENPIACAAIRVTFWTGWRIGEVLKLRWANVDLEGGIARLLETKTSDEEYRQLPEEAMAVIRAQIRVAGCPFVFPGRDLASHLTHVRKPWLRIRRRAGLDDLEGLGGFRVHDLRHNVVSWDVSRGVALEIAGRNVGHKSRRSTEVYAHFAPTALKRAADDRARAMRLALESQGRG